MRMLVFPSPFTDSILQSSHKIRGMETHLLCGRGLTLGGSGYRLTVVLGVGAAMMRGFFTLHYLLSNPIQMYLLSPLKRPPLTKEPHRVVI